MIYWPDKVPQDAVDFGADWAPTLAKLPGKFIVQSVWTRRSGNAVNSNAAIIQGSNGTKTGVRISGGTSGTFSIFRNTVTLNDGEILHEDALIKVI